MKKDKFKDIKLPENEGLPSTSFLPWLDPRVIVFLILLIPGFLLIVYLQNYFNNFGLIIGIIITFSYMLLISRLFYRWFKKNDYNILSKIKKFLSIKDNIKQTFLYRFL